MGARLPRRRWLRRARITLLALLVLAGLLMLDIASYARRHDQRLADVAIVLGAAVWDRAPSPVFAARIDHAIALYHSGRVRHIIFTGGQGAGSTLAESQVARGYALERGVPDAAIRYETASHITETNLSEAKKLLNDERARVLIVSDPLHMRRAITMARDLGLDAHPAPTPSSRYRSLRSRLGFLCRETFFYAGYLAVRLF